MFTIIKRYLSRSHAPAWECIPKPITQLGMYSHRGRWEREACGLFKDILIYSITATILLIAIYLPVMADSEEDMAKKSQNPVGDIISLPFENNLAFGVGEKDTEVYMLTAKPVYPTRVGNFNLINRFIMPFEYQGERVSGEGSKTGLGNLTYQAFFSLAKPGEIIWGVVLQSFCLQILMTDSALTNGRPGLLWWC